MAKKIISVEVPEELKEQLRIQAFNLNMSVSKLIRMLIEEGLKNHKGAADTNAR